MGILSQLLEDALHFVGCIIFCALACGYYVYGQITLAMATFSAKKDNHRLEQKNKWIVISGCDSGFGRMLAEGLLERTEFTVVALTLTHHAADELREEAKQSTAPAASERLVAMQCDITKNEDVLKVKQQLETLLKNAAKSGSSLYSLINNAGILDPGDFVWFNDISSFERVMDVNFFGQLRLTNALLPMMLAASMIVDGDGTNVGTNPRIINISSVDGAVSLTRNSSYHASKYALEAWNDSLRVELADCGIQVCKIRPGLIDTKIQTQYTKRILENFKTAPVSVRTMYGGDAFLKKAIEKYGKIDNMKKTPPSKVIDLIIKLVLQPKIQNAYWAGIDAKVFFRGLATLPECVLESVATALFRRMGVSENQSQKLD